MCFNVLSYYRRGKLPDMLLSLWAMELFYFVLCIFCDFLVECFFLLGSNNFTEIKSTFILMKK